MHTFDNFAEHYDKWFETCLGKFVADCERELILELAGPKSGEKILDVGIGTGFFASEILKYQVDIIGMDVSEKMLDIARSKGLTNVFTGDAAALDFPDEAFELVISITAFEFFREPEKSLSEMMRVCKRGGRVVVGTLGSGSWWAFKRRRDLHRNPDSVFRDARFYSYRELKDMADKFGSTTTIRGAVFVPPYNNAFCVSVGKLVEKVCRSLVPFWGAFLIFRIDKN
jgi:ubiquinone/menaquinone biosynthesis C-methylase UbiE